MPPPSDITHAIIIPWSKIYESLHKPLYLFCLFWIPVKLEVSSKSWYPNNPKFQTAFLPLDTCFEVQNLDMYIVSSKNECVTYTIFSLDASIPGYQVTGSTRWPFPS